MIDEIKTKVICIAYRDVRYRSLNNPNRITNAVLYLKSIIGHVLYEVNVTFDSNVQKSPYVNIQEVERFNQIPMYYSRGIPNVETEIIIYRNQVFEYSLLPIFDVNDMNPTQFQSNLIHLDNPHFSETGSSMYRQGNATIHFGNIDKLSEKTSDVNKLLNYPFINNVNQVSIQKLSKTELTEQTMTDMLTAYANELYDFNEDKVEHMQRHIAHLVQKSLPTTLEAFCGAKKKGESSNGA